VSRQISLKVQLIMAPPEGMRRAKRGAGTGGMSTIHGDVGARSLRLRPRTKPLLTQTGS